MSSRHKLKSGSSSLGGSSNGGGGGGGGGDKKPSKDPGIPKPPSLRGDSGRSKDKEKEKEKKVPKAGPSGGKDDEGKGSDSGGKSSGGGGDGGGGSKDSGIGSKNRGGKDDGRKTSGGSGSKNGGSDSKNTDSKGTGLPPAGLPQTGRSSNLVPPSKKGKEPVDRPRPRKLEVRSSAGSKPFGRVSSNDEDPESEIEGGWGNRIKKKDASEASASAETPARIPLYKLSKAEKELWSRDPLGGRHLPPEVRFRIYDYMLDNREVRQDISPSQTRATHSKDYVKNYGRAHTYKFNFALYRKYNSATRKEAITHFEWCNKLILVEYNMPLFKRYLHLHDVPIITDSVKLKNCKEHVAYFKVELTFLPWDKNLPAGSGATPTPPESGQVLMLEKDFEKLCHLLKYVFSYLPPRAACIASDRSETLDVRGDMSDIDAPILELRITNSVALGAAQDSLMRSLETIIGGGYRLTVSSDNRDDSIATPQHLSKLKQTMAPRLFWFPAYTLHQLFTARTIRDAALKRALNGDYVGARQRYFDLWRNYIIKKLMVRVALYNINVNDAQVERSSLVGMRGRYLDFFVYLEMAALIVLSGHPDFNEEWPGPTNTATWTSRLYEFTTIPGIPRKILLRAAHISLPDLSTSNISNMVV